MNDDLNTPKALAVFFSWMKAVNIKLDQNSITEIELGKAWEFLTVFDSIFGLIQNSIAEIPAEVALLLNKRNKARLENKWNESDNIRDMLKDMGWIVSDTSSGQHIKKTN
jgi:cysteinyl-tRNA synthetase